MRSMIVDEARTAARVQHEHCVRLFGVVELPRKGPAMVMELARGGSLRDVLDDCTRAPALPWALRAKWMLHVAKGMAALHAALPPIVHRDLKAANVLLSDADLPRAVAKAVGCGPDRRDTSCARGEAGK